MIALSIKLVLAHILGDFVFQPYAWVKDREQKGIKSVGLYNHIMVHVLMMYLVLWFDARYVAAFFVIPISHLIIDLLKSYFKNDKNGRKLFVIDQVLHLLVIAAVVYYYYPFELSEEQQIKVLMVVTALLLVTFVGGILLKVLLSKWNVEMGQGMEDAGKYIGMLERVFIFLFVALGQWAGIGFMVTAKSIFRFNDLSRTNDRKLTEYILIGTLLSFGFAISIGLVFRYLLDRV